VGTVVREENCPGRRHMETKSAERRSNKQKLGPRVKKKETFLWLGGVGKDEIQKRQKKG